MARTSLEQTLEDYPTLSSGIKVLECEMEILSQTQALRGAAPESPTLQLWHKRIQSKACELQERLGLLRELKAETQAVLDTLTDEEMKLVSLRYWGRRRNPEVAEALGMSLRTYFRRKRALLDKLENTISSH